MARQGGSENEVRRRPEEEAAERTTADRRRRGRLTTSATADVVMPVTAVAFAGPSDGAERAKAGGVDLVDRQEVRSVPARAPRPEIRGTPSRLAEPRGDRTFTRVEDPGSLPAGDAGRARTREAS